MYVSSEVSSNFLPETMPALFTKIVTTPTWASLDGEKSMKMRRRTTIIMRRRRTMIMLMRMR